MSSGPLRDFLVILAIFVGLGFLWWASGGPTRNGSGSLISPVKLQSDSDSDSSDRSAPSQPSRSSSRTKPAAFSTSPGLVETIVLDGETYLKSPWYQQVRLGRGNASSAYQTQKEYITLSYSSRSDTSLPISGWILENGRDDKLWEVSGHFVTRQSVKVALPYGVELLLPDTRQTPHPIILKPGDKAIVTTGRISTTGSPDWQTSFRTNLCTGYLNEAKRDTFTPSLRAACPAPREEVGADRLPDECYDFVRRLRHCHEPDTEEFRDREGKLVRNHLDGVTGLSRACREWVTTRFSYNSCVAAHAADPDFYAGEWRIYLGQNWQLWDDRRESITLYDASGRLVDRLTY
ncbi:MAG: hypothetical protein A2589_03380 [Candidatus Vogelbacteria bacterium RIFOXYD1_FULL_46_19]|uniref:LTD domain-containing protein n=1 Tax=Candidatus Vogelbacteria bacterium RIFOXYD1_FULL_46_19 TaxID=1802439 RepID=A0A1G2QGV8_9BACT|nr:MAG: hypothetical protein A2589_03380 [Candidatus Vogelbacteria bacterium RIFOXYD1_FULL_46_19]